MGASPVDYVVPTGGRTPEQVWLDLYDDAGSRHGHEYSGDLGSKHGFTIVARLPGATEQTLRRLGQLVGDWTDREIDGSTPTDRFPLTTACPARCGTSLERTYRPGKVAVRVMVKIREVVPLTTWQGKPDERQWLPSKMMTGSWPAIVERDCRRCGGTGQVPLEGEALAQRKREKAEFEKDATEFAGFPKKRFAEVYDDKWGPAAMVIGKDHTYVGGYCSS